MRVSWHCVARCLQEAWWLSRLRIVLARFLRLSDLVGYRRFCACSCTLCYCEGTKRVCVVAVEGVRVGG